MKIISATIEHLEILTKMNIDLRSDEQMDNSMSYEDVYKRMSGFITQNQYKVHLYDESDTILGYTVTDISKTPMYLRQLFIKKKYRHKGHGKTAVHLLLQQLNTQTLDIEVMSWNTSAIRFYDTFGFQKRYVGMRYQTA